MLRRMRSVVQQHTAFALLEHELCAGCMQTGERSKLRVCRLSPGDLLL